MTNKMIGKWVLGKQLGKGGQARVYIATVEGSDETFALKQLANTKSPQALARFAREIDALQKIDHPLIVKPVGHSDANDSSPYYVMPFECGVRKLSDLIWPRDGESLYKFQILKCIEFISQCAEAIAVAHQHVIHRDLKPDNILVREDGTPLIIDFGCCFPLDNDGLLTLTDEGVGARNFLAPECEAGVEGDIGSQSDVYSLGKILWCMISGERPFAREKPGFANKSITEMMPDHPLAPFATDILLESVRDNPKQRAKDAVAFSTYCKSVADRIRKGCSHPLYIAQRCTGCGSSNIKLSNNRIDAPMKLDAFVFIGNSANNPNLRAKFCIDCGTVTLHDSRPIDQYNVRLAEAT